MTLKHKDLVSRLQTKLLGTKMKNCRVCGRDKDSNEFYRAKANKDGLENKCKSCKAQYTKDYYLKNREKKLLQISQWKESNREYYLDYFKGRYSSNKDNHNFVMREHYKENKSLYRAKDAKYRASKLKATPLWADLEQIKRIYVACAKVSERTGVEHHVDHIIPLQGDNVCGLHVERNLAIIPAKMNLEKSNSFTSWATD